MVDIDTFARPQYEFTGIYRGVVEDNVDPLDAGRVKVRVFGIHDFNGKVTPIEELPWAIPSLNLYWSGGHNITNKDHEKDSPDKPGERYDPGASAKISSPAEEKRKSEREKQLKSKTNSDSSDKDFKVEEDDDLSNSCGTGGQFVVPKRGNWVYVFFEAGNHMNPVYFGMAPMARDWDKQKEQRNKEVIDKISQVFSFKKNFKPRKISSSFLKNPLTWAPYAYVNALVDLPRLNIPILESDNKDVYCMTSEKGTSIIIDNRYEQEKFYIVHKNYIDSIDSVGNKNTYVGRSHSANGDPDTAANYELGVEGNHEIFVVGDYKLYPKGNIFIQCDEHVQIDAKKSVGVVAREGDVNVVIEKGSLNADIKTNADINIGGNANIKVDKNVNLQVSGDVKASVKGNINATVTGNAVIGVVGDVNATIGGNVNVAAAGDINLTSPNVKITGNVNIVGELNVTGGDISTTGSARVGQFLYSLLGVDCGGFIRNRGPVDIGGPCIIHGLTVLPGVGTGVGRPPKPATPATPPTTLPSIAIREGEIKPPDILAAKFTRNETIV